MKVRKEIDSYDRETKPYVVAYLDILGATNRINSRSSQIESLNVMHNLYTHITDLANPDTGVKRYEGIKFKIFSDNIIIAKELDDSENVETITNFLSCVSNFLCTSVSDSVCWLVRGGITTGDFYIDDTIVWGSALVRAHELEDKIAIYPRVILDHSVVETLAGKDEAHKYILRDHDGLHFLNYMAIWHFSGQYVKKAFDQMKEEARNPDGTFQDKIYQKLHWHMEYVNCQLDIKKERKDRNYRLSLEPQKPIDGIKSGKG